MVTELSNEVMRGAIATAAQRGGRANMPRHGAPPVDIKLIS